MKAPRSVQQIPHGSWVFYQKDVRIVGFTYDDLLTKVAAHRSNNSLERQHPDEVKADVDEQLCARDPDWCFEPETPPLGEQVVQYGRTMKAFFEGGAELVDQAEADRRAAICVACPKNIPMSSEVPCLNCGRKAATILQGIGQSAKDIAVEATRRLILGPRKTASDALLRFCVACGCDNKLSVWFPKDALVYSPSVKANFPKPCWKLEP